MQYDIFAKLEKIDQLIRKRDTGPPRELARKVELSERVVYDYLKLMKWLGAPIRYHATQKSYYYERAGRLVMAFQPKKAAGASGKSARRKKTGVSHTFFTYEVPFFMN